MANNVAKINTPKLWNNESGHFNAVLTDHWYKLIFQLSSQFLSSTHSFFQQEGMTPVLMPITMGSVSSPMGKGSDSIPVGVELFGQETFLADSMQFQLEYLLRLADKGVYYVMPTFRGEDHNERHLNQFFHSEVEIRGGFTDIIKLAERYFISITKDIIKSLGNVLEQNGFDTSHLLKIIQLSDGFPMITYVEALQLLGNTDVFFATIDGTPSITAKGEQALIKELGGICWLINLPSDLVPFYQARLSGDDYAICADLLCGIGETLGLGERHTTMERVQHYIGLNGIDPQSYAWYLNMKNEYPLKTAGFGLGMERYMLWLLNHNDIRDIPLIQRLKNVTNTP